MVPLLASFAGALLGAFTAWPAYRLSVPFGNPAASACGSCSASLTSWVRPTTRCGSCHARLGVNSVWTALAGATAWGLLAWAWPIGPFLGACLFLATAGVLLVLIDLKVLRLPDPVVLVCFGVTVILLAGQALSDGTWRFFGRALLGGAAAFGLFLLIGLLPGAPMGMGDVKLAGVIGLTLGYLGWPAVVIGMLMPFLVNGPFAVVALIRRGRKAVSPFGPALLAGWLITVVLVSPSVL